MDELDLDIPFTRYVKINEKIAKYIEENSFGYKLEIDGTKTFIGLFPRPDLAKDTPPTKIMILYRDDGVLLGLDPVDLDRAILSLRTFAKILAKLASGDRDGS